MGRSCAPRDSRKHDNFYNWRDLFEPRGGRERNNKRYWKKKHLQWDEERESRLCMNGANPAREHLTPFESDNSPFIPTQDRRKRNFTRNHKLVLENYIILMKIGISFSIYWHVYFHILVRSLWLLVTFGRGAPSLPSFMTHPQVLWKVASPHFIQF